MIKKEIEIKNLPNHLVIVPDGNRRWAKRRKKQAWDGHEAGAEVIENLVRQSMKLGIKNMSFWGSSVDNLTKRSWRETRALLKIYEKYFERLMKNDDLDKYQVKINIIGRWEEQFPEKLKKILREGIEKTKNYKKRTLNFFLAYNGDDEMLQTIKTLVEKYKSARQITKKVIKEHLMTYNLPEVDYLIRTGGEPHLSAGFMMWDTANTQLYFSPKLFPDFRDKELILALEEFSRRERRRGK